MEIIRYILLVVEVGCSLILIGLILIQKSKSEGLGMAFGSGMGENLFGSRAGNVLTKLTVAFATLFMANTLVLAIVDSGVQESSLMSREAPAVPVQRTPPGGVPAPPASIPPTLPAAPGGDSEGATAPVTAPSGIPTLPGADLGDTPPVQAVPGAVQTQTPDAPDAEAATPEEATP